MEVPCSYALLKIDLNKVDSLSDLYNPTPPLNYTLMFYISPSPFLSKALSPPVLPLPTFPSSSFSCPPTPSHSPPPPPQPQLIPTLETSTPSRRPQIVTTKVSYHARTCSDRAEAQRRRGGCLGFCLCGVKSQT